MNERIKQLLLQAGFTNAYTDPKEGFELVFVDEEHTTESVAEFAMLMHDECIDAVPNDIDPATYFKVLQAIKKHFGF